MESNTGWIVFLKDYLLLTVQNLSEALRFFNNTFNFTIILFYNGNFVHNSFRGEY